MAKEEIQEDNAATKEVTEEESSAAKSKKKFPKKTILIAAGGLVILILCAVGYLVFAPSSQADPAEEGEDITVADEGEEAQEEDAKTSRRSEKPSRRGTSEKKPSTDIYYTDFAASIVNLAASEKYDYVYLKYGFTLELADNGVRAELTTKMPKLVSIVDSVVSGRQWDKINNPRGREELANDIVEAINEQLETGEVIACHFMTFVAQ